MNYKEILLECVTHCTPTTKEVGILNLRPFDTNIKDRTVYYPSISLKDYNEIATYLVDEMFFTDDTITFLVTDPVRKLAGYLRFDKEAAIDIDNELEEHRVG